MARLLFAAALLLYGACGFAQPVATGEDSAFYDSALYDTSRVVALGGSVTEIIFALGVEDRLVAVDTSSVYPPQGVNDLSKVGYLRQLAAEGVLSLYPSLIVTTPDAGPPEVLEQIGDAGVTIVVVPDEDSVEGAKAKIRGVAEIFGLAAQADDLIRQIDLDVAEARLYLASRQVRSAPKVMFIYARGGGTLSVAGTATSADAMIRLAGGVNSVTGYEGYKPLTAEAAVAAAPEVLLLLSRGLESVGGIDGLWQLPGLALTPAGQNRRVVALDDLYLLGFGPRVGQAVLDLTLELHPELSAKRP
ncbi:MAG: hemin ABC transporter substrate-binding protein [Deinococcota bacterium]|nr:hemin ABC transporter substrate-binding protein [Deinococcota bacterium]